MHPPLLAPPLRTNLDTRSPEFLENRDVMRKRLEEIESLLDEAEQGGGAYHHERLAKRGKLPVRERIALALDPDSPFLEISSLAAYNSSYTIGVLVGQRERRQALADLRPGWKLVRRRVATPGMLDRNADGDA